MNNIKQFVAILAAIMILVAPAQNVHSKGTSIRPRSEAPAAVVMVFSTDPPTDPSNRQSSGEFDVQESPTQTLAADVPIMPGKTSTADVSVRKDGGTGAIIPNSDITYNPQAGSFKGGHEHSVNPRPLGSFQPASFNTGPTGVVRVTYTAPAVSGQVFVNGSCRSGDGSSCTWIPWNFNVRVPGLVELKGGGLASNYLLIGDETIHPRNHFGTPANVQALQSLAAEYAKLFSGDRLQFNDTSLEWGGIFDVSRDRQNKEWVAPHAEHRLGLETDLRSKAVIGPERRLALLHLANKLGFGVLIHDGTVKGDVPHWHLRFRESPECEIFKRGQCNPASLPGIPSEGFVTTQTNSPTLNTQVQVSQDPATRLYLYNYTFTNDSSSTSQVSAIQLLVNHSVVLDVKAPHGWTSQMWLDGAAIAFAATEVGSLPPGFVDDGQLVPSPFQITPGQTLSGFSFRSPDPPSNIEILAQGFQLLPLIDENSSTNPGGLAENSFKGLVQGPVSSASVINRIDDIAFFVRQHYQDFLSRDPDTSGFQFWANEVSSCGSNQQCIEIRRINVSAAFFLSIEFQDTGYLVYRIYKAAFGNMAGTPVAVRREELVPDTRLIGQGVVVGVGDWQGQLNVNKNAYARDFVASSRFNAAYPTNMTAAQFVDKLNGNAGGVLSAAERASLISEMTNPADAQQRANTLRKVAENTEFARREFNSAFVLMQYFGYLSRNPNDSPDINYNGFNFWLQKLNQFNGNFVQAEMVKAFITSGEYRHRFDP